MITREEWSVIMALQVTLGIEGYREKRRPEGDLAIRLSSEEREKFIAKHNTGLFAAL